MVGGCDRGPTAAEKEEKELLEREVADYRRKYENEADRVRDLKAEIATLEGEKRDAERSARTLERELTKVQQDLASRIEREERERERAATPSETELVEKAKETLTAAQGAVVTIEGNASSGRGVLVKADDKVWIYLPANLVATNRKLVVKGADGNAITAFGSFQLASDAGLARLEIPAGSDAALTPTSARDFDPDVPLVAMVEKAPVAAGVYDEQETKAFLSRKFNDLEAGAPLLSGATGELIGIAAKEPLSGRTLWKTGRTSSRYRSVMLRLDREVTFKAIPIGSFLEEGSFIEESDLLSRFAEVYLRLNPGTGGMSLDVAGVGGGTVRDFFKAHPNNPAGQAAVELDKWLRERGPRASEADRVKQISGPYGNLLNRIQARSRELAGRRFSAYHQEMAKQSQEWLAQAENELKEYLKHLEKR